MNIGRRCRPVLPLVLLLMAAGGPAFAQDSASPEDLAAGRRLYRQGLLPSGEPVVATVVGDVTISGAQAACIGCHRRSGVGSVEGNEIVPPVIGPILFDTADPRSAAFKKRREGSSRTPDGPGSRPAYDDESLARAIREGIDSAGHPIDRPMPRYRLDDRQVGQLITYLKTLSAAPSPGVTDTEIHFATVFAGPVPAGQRAVALAVLDAYARDMNGLTRNERQQAERGPWYREWETGSYRQWKLHVWDLTGPPESWPAQLDALYRAQPVFALLGGVGEGDWAPVHRFCAENEVPCLLPHTDRPVVEDGDFYSIYFSRGLAQEGQALASYLSARRALAAGGTILQVVRPGTAGAAPAASFRQALREAGFAGLTEREIATAGAPDADFWAGLFAAGRPGVLVLWLGAGDLAAAGGLAESLAGIDGPYLSASLLGDSPEGPPPALRARAHLIDRHAPPDEMQMRMARLRPWLRARGIEESETVVLTSAYTAARMAGNALRQMGGFLLRDHFVESIEHLAETTQTVSPYPALTLGPGQRFMSSRIIVLHPPQEDGTPTPADEVLLP